MELKNFIKIYDDTVPIKLISSFLKYININTFENAGIVGFKETSTVNKEVRNTETFSLYSLNTLSCIHWANFFRHLVSNNFRRYANDVKSFANVGADKILNLDVLKYETGGFYIPHTDHHEKYPRTISVIYFLNNDYKGGELCFHNPDQKGEKILTVTPKPGRIVLWPSNFLYPHSVSKVTEGRRFVLVSWLV